MAYPANLAVTNWGSLQSGNTADIDTNFRNLQVALNGIGNGVSVLSSVTITTASIATANISLMQGNVSITGGSASLTQANVSTVYAGNVAASFFTGDGSKLTNLPASSVTGVAGDSRNLIATISNNTVATVSYDQVITSTALNGTPYMQSSGNLTFNRNTVGVGGMDARTSPTNGWVTIYVVSNPSNSAVGLLGTAGNTTQTTIYSGSNSAAGFTASSLVAIIPTDGTGNLSAGMIYSRRFWYKSPTIVFNGATGSVNLTAQSLSNVVPASAKTVSLIVGDTVNNALNFFVSGDSSGTGFRGVNVPTGTMSPMSIAGLNLNPVATIIDVPIVIPQTIYWREVDTRTTNAMIALDYTW